MSCYLNFTYIYYACVASCCNWKILVNVHILPSKVENDLKLYLFKYSSLRSLALANVMAFANVKPIILDLI